MAARGSDRTAASTDDGSDGIVAKISHPRLFGAADRERLYQRLDQLRDYPVVWLAGPPGGGKTTLVASYLRQRRIRSIWYQLDAGDEDPSSFFFYLTAAAKRLAPRKPVLPLLTPEYLSDLAGFTRRYFRELFARIPNGGVLVLDNLHEIAPSSEFHDVLLTGLREIPPGRNLIIISRAEADARYMQAVASGSVHELNWTELKLTPEETAAVCAGRRRMSADAVRMLHEACDGWAAGLVLMLQRADGDSLAELSIGLASREAVFDYFATTILARLTAEKQRALMLFALLPTLSADAAQVLTEDLGAAALLEELYRRNLFVQRVGSSEPVYRLHGLLRDFLLSQARVRLGTDELVRARQHGARLCESQGQVEQAFQLWRDSGAWDECSRLALGHAPGLFAAGRWQTLQGWLAALPSQTMGASPWLAYWLGMCLFQTNQRSARAALSDAYEAFQRDGDTTGQMLTAASILIGYYLEYSDWEQAEPWILRLGLLLERRPEFPSREMEMTVYSGMLYGIAIRRPDHPLLPACVERTVGLIERDLPTNARMLAGLAITGPVACMLGDFSLFYRVRKMLLPLLQDGTLTELNRAAWHMTNGAKMSLSAEYEGTYDELDRGAQLSAEYNLPQLEFLCHAFTNLHAGSYLDVPRAEASLQAMQRVVNPARSLERFHLLISEGVWETINGRFDAGVQRHREALVAAESVGGAAHRLVDYVFQCGALVLAGRIAEGADLAQEGLRFARSCQIQTWSACFVLVLAWCHYESGDLQEGDRVLAQAMDAGDDGSYRYFRWLMQGCRKVLALALERGIRAEAARKMVRHFRYVSPDPLLEVWPWPVKIRTLGRFEIEVDGQVLRFGRKAPKRLLALLQFVIASGGRDVSENRIADTLWPDADGDEARQRLKLSVHRVRHLIGDDDGRYIQYAGGKVTLNRECVWVDALCLAQASEHNDVPRFRQMALDSYAGDFLEHEPEESWMLSVRTRLRKLHAQALRGEASAASDTEMTPH